MNLDEIQRTHHTKIQIKFRYNLDEIRRNLDKFRQKLEEKFRQNLDKIQTKFRQNLDLIQD